jgi:DNA invertase Pin-like site-specific DNA recombinase
MQFLYARVSASDQTAAHQLEKARAAGFDIAEDNVIKDEGVFGHQYVLRRKRRRQTPARQVAGRRRAGGSLA